MAPGYAGIEGVDGVSDQGRAERQGLLRVRTGEDSKFGYFSIAGIVDGADGLAHWNVHGGVEWQLFGDNIRAYNGSVTTATAGCRDRAPSASGSRTSRMSLALGRVRGRSTERSGAVRADPLAADRAVLAQVLAWRAGAPDPNPGA